MTWFGFGLLVDIDRSENVMKSFLNSSGITDSLQLVVETPSLKEPELRLLQQPFAVIGRDPRADVFLDHAEVSRRHVYLQVIEGRAFWIDLESRMGSRDEKKFQKFGWMEGKHTLGIGPYVIRRFANDSQIARDSQDDELPRDTPLIAQAHHRGSLPEVILEFLNGPSQSTSWPVHRVMSLIGSASGCKFRLTDPSVSRFHGSLVRTSAGVWIVDLLGKGGITVDGVPIRSHHLQDGEVLGIGRYQLRIRCRLKDDASDHGRSALVARSARSSHVPNTIKFPDWAASAPAPASTFETGSQGTKNAQFPQPVHPQSVSSFPNMEIISSESGLPFHSAQSNITETVLVPLVNQFSLMQQQMFDQFQQAMAMMIQMFGTMHRDQMEVIRAELNRLHELTDEFHALKEELATRTREQALKEELATRTREQASPTMSGSRGPERLGAVTAKVSGAKSQPQPARAPKPANGQGAASVEPVSVVPPRSAASAVQSDHPVRVPRVQPSSAAPPQPAASGFPGDQPVHAARIESGSVAPPQPAASGVEGARPVREARIFPTVTTPTLNPAAAVRSTERPQDAAPRLQPKADDAKPGLQPKSEEAKPTGDSDRDTMIWLHQRIMTLQTERETRWQKILKLLPGVSS
jgi:pSer/pThr/pTyr-binding forkhead associated (FHA) protein